MQSPIATQLVPWIAPFGQIFVNMLKMIVIPVVFFSLIVGAASLPLKRFGPIGLKVIIWYFATSLMATLTGVAIALVIKPGSGAGLDGWQSLAGGVQSQAAELATRAATSDALVDTFLGIFANPFEALATGNFLPIITFSILFGLAMRVCLDRHESRRSGMSQLSEGLEAARDAMFVIVDWVLEYSPIGVFALSIVNFGLYGPKIVGPYIQVVLGVVLGILLMIFVVYSLVVYFLGRVNPITFFRRIRKAMITAFVTRSSAATLPVSIQVSRDELKIRDEISSFSLPLGATINMDGVCIHLPMFALLAANIFGIDVGPAALFSLVLTTVLAAVGAGGVPGGSLMLLFIILETMGLSNDQVAVIVALALGVNPILDMFETMNNVTGDIVCTYLVAKNENLLQEDTAS